MMIRFSKLPLILAMIALVISLNACSKKTSPVTNEIAKSNSMAEKLEPFITCLNRTDRSLMDKASKYRAFFTEVAAAPNKEHYKTNFWGFKIEPYETNNEFSRKCIAGLKAAVAQAPSDAVLDDLGRNYADTLEALIPSMNDADNYYAQKNYRDDKMAKGRELDGKIWPLLTRLADLSEKIREVVKQKKDQIAEAELAEIEKSDGKKFTWHTENVMLQARRSLTNIHNAAQNDKLDIKTVSEAETQMQQAFDNALAYATANPNVKTRLGNQPMWFMLQSSVQNYLQAIKTLRRDMSDGKKDLSSDGTALQNSYNRLVENYNLRVKFQ